MPLILGTNSIKDTGFNVDNSLRFNFASSDGLTKTLGTPTDNKKWTYSFWVKQCSNIGNVLNTGSDTAYIYFRPNDADPAPSGFSIEQYVSSFQYRIIPNMVFRDHSAWRHIVIAFDTTQGTDTNRVKVYNNGTQITSFNTATYPSQNLDTQVNSAVSHKIGGLTGGTSQNLDGYLSEVCFIDGQQLAADQFGEFDEDSGTWKPIDVSGLTFGDNGFYLEFKQAGTGTNASGMGADTSGNDNHFAVANLTAVDQSTDTCTNNFMTLNPLITLTSVTDNQVYSEGNTIVIPNSTDNYGTAFGTFGATRGKWYWEAQIIWNGTSNNANFPKQIGFMREDYAFNKSYLGQNDDQTWGVGFADLDTDGWGLDHNGSFGAISGATTLADDKMVMFALDLDNGKFYMGYDGTFFTSGDPTSGATGTGAIATLDATDLSFTIIPALTNATNTTYYKMNFGNPAYAIASSNADGNGFGNFEFAVPSGYFSWCTKNLAEYG